LAILNSRLPPPAETVILLYAQRAHAEHVLEGLRKAGLEIPGNQPVVETASRL
jgi:hypothetical protein